MARLLRLLPDSASLSRTSKRGSVEDCVCIFGGSGEPGKTASKNYAIAAYRSSMQRWRPARPRASGECQDTRRSNRRCATAISTRSVSPESTRPPKLNSIEPPLVRTRMPGGLGGVASRGVPLSRSIMRRDQTPANLWPTFQRPAKPRQEANGGAQCGKSARCVRRGGG